MRGDRGLTVVEVLLTVMIFSVAAAAVYRVFVSALKANERVDRSLALNLKILSAAQQLEDDLSNAVLSSTEPWFEGNAESISMLAAHADRLVAVRYDRNEKGDLIRFSDGKENVLLAGSELNDFAFSFGYMDRERPGSVWKEVWNSHELPFAVRWSARIVNGAGIFPVERTIFMPHGEWGRL